MDAKLRFVALHAEHYFQPLVKLVQLLIYTYSFDVDNISLLPKCVLTQYHCLLHVRTYHDMAIYRYIVASLIVWLDAYHLPKLENVIFRHTIQITRSSLWFQVKSEIFAVWPP